MDFDKLFEELDLWKRLHPDSDWTDESEKIEADMWAYNQGIDGEMINWIWEKAGSKAEFYDLCHKQLNCRPVCNYTEEMKEIICSIFD